MTGPDKPGRLQNWGTFTPHDFMRRAVHLKAHPEHKAFIRSLEAEPDLRDGRVSMPNFGALAQG